MGVGCRDRAGVDAFTVATSMSSGLLGPLGFAVHAAAIGAPLWRKSWRPGVADLSAGNGPSRISIASDSGTAKRGEFLGVQRPAPGLENRKLFLKFPGGGAIAGSGRVLQQAVSPGFASLSLALPYRNRLPYAR